MVRVPVTDVDAWRYWRSQPDATLDDLRTRLMKREPVSDSLAMGRALHEALEHASVGDEIAEVLFDGKRLRVDCDAAVPVLSVRECPVTRRCWVPSVQDVVCLSGRVDASDGHQIDDYKTTSRFDPEYLYDLMQWRFYLWMTGAKVHVWHVFEILDPLQREPDVYRLVRAHALAQTAYPGLADDCERELDAFMAVVASSLPEYIEARTVADVQQEVAC